MPTIFEPEQLPLTEKDGVQVTILASPAMLGTDALQVEYLLIAPGARSAPYAAEAGERFLYVIRGRGEARVGDDAFPLAAESVLWLEESDSLQLEAGPDELEVLLCRAPSRD